MASERFDLADVAPTAVHCDACLDRFMDRAKQVRGVLAARPALDRRSVEIETDGTNHRWREQLANVGAGVADGVGHKIYRLKGLDHQRGAEKLQQTVSCLPGVNYAHVSYTSRKLFLEYDGSRFDGRTVIQAATRAGVTLVASEQGPLVSPSVRLFLTGLLLLLGSLLVFLQGTWAWALLLPVVVVEGSAIFRGAWESLRRRTANMNVLMAIAVLGAVTLGEWSEAAGVVWLAALGGLVQDWAIRKTRTAVDALLALSPTRARVVRAEDSLIVEAGAVAPGELVEVHPGELFPLDGVVEQGNTEAIESALTGESLPVIKGPSDRVFAGTVNGSGTVRIRVTGGVADTAFARMIRSIEESQQQRAPLQTAVDRFAAVYTPAVVLFAALLASVPPIFGGEPWGVWVSRALWLLIVACPCALVISTPVAVVAAVGAASRLGILVKGGAVFDALARARCVVFDKTGTLTHAALEVSEVRPSDGTAEVDLLQLAAAVEAHSMHPAARAIVREAERRRLRTPTASDVRVVPGCGIIGSVGGQQIRVGSSSWLGLVAQEEAGFISVHVSGEDRSLGSIRLRDTLRYDAAGSVGELRRLGIERVLLMSGDKRLATAKVAGEADIAEYEGGLMPEDKAARVRQLVGTCAPVIMVGDGLNDLPAMKAATIAVTMGRSGAEAAVEHGDVVLKEDRIDRLPTLIRLARRTARIMRQNIAIAVLCKLALVALSVPYTLPLWLAVLGDVGLSLLVTLNATRLASVRGLS